MAIAGSAWYRVRFSAKGDRMQWRGSTTKVSAARAPGTRAAGCLAWAFYLWLECSIGIAIAFLVGEQLSPALAERGFNVRTGAGVLIGWGLGAIVAIYPMIWLHRLGRRLIG